MLPGPGCDIGIETGISGPDDLIEAKSAEDESAEKNEELLAPDTRDGLSEADKAFLDTVISSGLQN